MQRYKFLFCSLFFLASTITIAAQSNCKDQVRYQTINLGDGKSALSFPLVFKFSKDSLQVFSPQYEGVPAMYFMQFRIVSKTCNWSTDQITGTSKYALELADEKFTKSASLLIEANNGKGKITLVYEGSAELRVFELKTLSIQ